MCLFEFCMLHYFSNVYEIAFMQLYQTQHSYLLFTVKNLKSALVAESRHMTTKGFKSAVWKIWKLDIIEINI